MYPDNDVKCSFEKNVRRRVQFTAAKIHRASLWRCAGTLIICALLLVAGREAQAQNYLLRYVNVASGAVTFTGNSLGLAKQSGTNAPGTSDAIGTFTTLNTNLQVGTYPRGTTLNWSNNSSAAVLRLPTNSTVLYAELIWAGSAQINADTTPAGNVLSNLNTAVKFILPDGSTNSVAPDPVTASFVTNGTSAIFYVRSANVTALVRAAGAGTYAAGGVPGTVLASEDANNACGWTLAVVYGNELLHERNLSLFVGNSFAISGGTAPAPAAVTGFCTPPTGTVNARLYVSAVEGDPNKTGDQMLFGPTTNSLQQLSGPNNLVNNFFASQINGDNGLLDTSGTFGLSNSVPPNVGYSARQGWDITSVDVSSALTNGMTSAYAQNITQGDGYSVNALALQIDVGSPVLTTTQSVDKASTFVGDILTYTVTVTNSGTADAMNLIFTDPLPFGTSFITNTFTTNGVLVAGADPVNGVPIPAIKQNSTLTITYQVVVGQIPPTAKFITAATLVFQFAGACANSPVINGTLVNADVQTLVPLLLVSKAASITNVIPGAAMTYTISVPNVGTTNTTGSTLLDPIPVGVTYVTNTTTLNGISIPDINGTNMPYTVAREIHGPGRATGIINVGDTAVVTFQVKISTNPPPRINNSATIYANGIAATSAQNAAANITPVYSDLAVGITGSPNPVGAGAPISYTISVTNNGPDAVNTITNFITLLLPLDDAILSPVYIPSTGTYNPLNGVWSGITLLSNGVVTMTITGQVNPNTTAGSVISSVTVTPPPGVLDIVTNNNTATCSNTVAQVADLAVTISDGVTNVYQGDPLTYAITIVNLGPGTLASLNVSNALPAFLTNALLLTSAGTYNSFNGNWSGLSLASGDSVTLTVSATILTNALGAFTNSVSVSVPAGVTDPVLSNNSAADVDYVYAKPDLGINLTGPASVYAGTNYTYSIFVTNTGLATASNVVVGDTLPTNVIFVQASGAGTTNVGVVTWNLGSLPVHAGTNLTFSVTAPLSGNVTNFAIVGPIVPDLNVTNNTSATVITAVIPLANLAIGKSGSSSVFAGSNLTYTISVTNFGPSSASGVVVTDALPATVFFVFATGGGVSNNGAINWSLGTLSSGQVSNLTLIVKAPANGIVTNTAQVSSPILDTNIVNNVSAPVVSTVIPFSQTADVAVALTGPANVFAGTNYAYSISVTNAGPATASNVFASDVLPTNVVFVSTSGGGTTNLGVVTWSLGTLPSGAVTNVTFIVTAPLSGTITNGATASSTTPDANLGNNSSSLLVTTVTPLADVIVASSGANSVLAGGTITYTVTVTNSGTSTASNVVVSDVLPTNSMFVSASGGGGTNNGVVIWPAITAFTNGGTFTFTVTVIAPAGGTLTNVVSSTSLTVDPVPGNNDGSSLAATTITTVIPVADLAVGKTGPIGIVFGTNFSYIISVTNFGPSTATSIFVTDTLPAGLVFVSSLPAATTNASSQVIWTNLGSLPAGATTNLTLTVNSTLLTTVTNFAAAGSPVLDPNTTNSMSGPVVTAITNIPPIANPDGYGVTENSTNSFSPLTNDVVQTPGGYLIIIGVSATNGTATISGTNLIFIPATNFIGIATVVYSITDNVGGTNSGVITVTVTNIPPIANPDTYSIAENTTNSFSPLVNDLVQTPGGSLILVSVTTTNGTALVSGTNIIFIPATNFIGVATLIYSVTDGIGGTNSSTITVTVTNVPPLANPDSYGMTENSTNSFSPLTNDLLLTPGGELAIVNVSPTNGSATIISGTNILFIPTTNFIGVATIGYTITDSVGGTNSSLISVTVTNIPPLANPDYYTVLANSTNTFSPLTNDLVQTPGGTLTIISVNPTNGTATFNGTNVIFTPTTNFTGFATIGYTIKDNVGGTNSSFISVTVTNAAPVAFGQSVTTSENTSRQITLNGSDPTSRPLTFVIVSAPTNGTLTLLNTNTGTVTYTPNTNYSGTDAFNFLVNNGLTSSTNATIAITVVPVADLMVVESGPTNGVAGSNLVYTLTVTNLGPATATNIVITSQLPIGFTFVTNSASGIYTNGLVTWTIPSLPVNGRTNFTVTAFAAEGGIYTNLASGAAATLDLNPTNNNGTLTNAATRTVISALADVAVFKDGGTNVYAGQAVAYVITATNAGPSTATNVIVQDVLPVGAIFQSASGSYSISNGVVTWSSLTLAPNTAATFNITLIAPASVTTFLNIALANSPTPDPNPTNNNGSFSKSRVTTKVVPSADLIALLSGPASAIQGSNFVYSLIVTNAGPSVSSNIVVSDAFPSNLVFVSASSGGVFTNNIIIWPPILSLAVGASTNYTITARSLNAGVFTNLASALAATFDPNVTNNSGVASASQVQTTVGPAQFGFLMGAPVFNPQTGLFEESVNVTNTGTVTVAGFRLYVGGLRSGVSLYNAIGTNNGLPYVQYNFAVDPSNYVGLILEFYNPSRLAFTNTLSAEAILPPNTGTSGTNGSVLINRIFPDNRFVPARVVIEFNSVPGKVYTILYSTNLTAAVWKVATPTVTANANVTQWYDDGPPKTDSKPAAFRYYRIIQN